MRNHTHKPKQKLTQAITDTKKAMDHFVVVGAGEPIGKLMWEHALTHTMENLFRFPIRICTRNHIENLLRSSWGNLPVALLGACHHRNPKP